MMLRDRQLANFAFPRPPLPQRDLKRQRHAIAGRTYVSRALARSRPAFRPFLSFIALRLN